MSKQHTPFRFETVGSFLRPDYLKKARLDFENGKSYVMGAAEFIFKDKNKYKEVFDTIESIKDTVRIIVLASSEKSLGNGLPDDITPLAVVLIKDKLRENVNNTINYFKEQGVALKVISGDSVKTVQNIAKDTGITGAENAIDMTTVKTHSCALKGLSIII